MSYHQPSTSQGWDGSGGAAAASPFSDDRRDDQVYGSLPATSMMPSHPYSNSGSRFQQALQDQEEEQYPIGRPLSYFPTHHQPLSQHDDYDQPISTQMAPLEHAQSALSSRTPEWGGGGYQGYQPSQSQTDIPMVGINIISSNLEAARNNNTRFSDTRTAENMATPAMNPSTVPVQAYSGNDRESTYSTGAGVGVGNTSYNNNSDSKHGHGSSRQPDDGTRSGQHNQALPAPPLISDNVDVERGGERERIPKALLDPKVQKQLKERQVWRPWFIWLVSALQIGVLVFEIVKGYQRTGKVVETQPFNPMIGPGTGTIIAVGARFVPCMRSTYLDNLQIQCPDQTTEACTISDICGFTSIASTGGPPNQWFRFITPIFLHGGIVHLGFNLMFQLRTGADLERDMGWWRIGIIYLCSGIVGFVFGGNFAPLLSPSMGASGAIFGLIGCLVLDLIQNWKLVVRPCWELTKLSIMIIVSFAFGLLPFLDNFAHIGGFVAGILSGLVFMPVVYFSKRDKFIKMGLRFIALPLIILIIVLGLTNFYKGANNCSWCKYLSCLPINGWCDAFDTPPGAPTGAN
ncbi:hypothetical protein BGX34_009574 [Mortierella sp. NVP85]|nr:hypothetical protein BGX34_009574 [Mortierella sp. NVP85]